MNNKQHAQTGRLMFIIAWLIFFMLLFTFFYYYNQNEQGSYRIEHGTVTITPDAEGHYRIDGSIDDYPVRFMIDTGASLVAIPQELATQLGLQGRYAINLQTAGGEVTGYLTRLKKLSFAGFTLNNIKAVIIAGGEDNEVLLGMNVLSQFNLSQQDKRLIIKK
ncbi:retropepsin-like aspartic protease family protein [Legionella micdadei]|uniref:Aspartyl protease n=1 Tax=Legionella micdadei TaxID=451 RepID=A0A098GHF0_LEGMI|nr:retropepsin-like aspartic protease [Legionella micdadei]ARG96726.1 aspartyl protease [Legionella micdadei]KTD26391.1 aspartyl protease [Legionella micdadei]NSL19033.1 retroviral-like aspartic protease family protein [Legionella micdadei]CEG61894.1 aspartyl protease [Legionella micdadei]SCY66355.1 aspartyl protease family protein [Legionella micdadei]